MDERQAELIWTPFFALFKKEVLRFWRVIAQTILVPLTNSFLYLLIFGVSLGKRIEMGSDMSYLTFLIPGLAMMGLLNNAFQNSSSSIGTSKFHGDLEDLRVVPLSAFQIVLALGLGGVARGIFVGLITFTVGQLFHFTHLGAFLPVAHPFSLLFYIFTGGMTFSLLGIALALKAKSIDQLTVISGFILLPLMYLGGVFFSIHTLPQNWQHIAMVNPMLYFIDGIRYGVLGVSDIRGLHSAAFCMASLLFVGWFALHTVKTASFNRW